jgi:hypothetical protein
MGHILRPTVLHDKLFHIEEMIKYVQTKGEDNFEKVPQHGISKLVMVNIKFTLEQARNSQRGSRGIALPFH